MLCSDDQLPGESSPTVTGLRRGALLCHFAGGVELSDPPKSEMRKNFRDDQLFVREIGGADSW